MLGLLVATVMAQGCSGNGNGGPGGTNADGGNRDGNAGGSDGGNVGGSDGASGPDPALFASPLCRAPYPAQACDGDPHGRWTLAGLCVKRYENCPGAVVMPTGTATATIEFEDGAPEAYFEYQFDYDIETRLSVPASCLGGASCESIGCFAGEDPCSCVVGGGRGGSVRAEWMPNISGEVVTAYPGGSQTTPLRFCAGATTADSLIGGTRVIWNRVCTENMDCRPSNPCHVGKAHCTGGAPSLAKTPARTGRSGRRAAPIRSAMPRVPASPARRAPRVSSRTSRARRGSSRAARLRPFAWRTRTSRTGRRAGSNAPAWAGSASPTTASRATRTPSAGIAAPAATRSARPAIVVARARADTRLRAASARVSLRTGRGTRGSCKKACFQGRCLTEIGQLCTRDSECGSGHCTCWSQTCSGGRLCSRVACPCQWARSGADTCSGPLMDGLMDFTCRSPQMCVQGMCQ